MPDTQNREYRTKFRRSKSFGEYGEYLVIAELLKRGFDVYTTIVDDRGTDCVIRLNSKKYLDIQIKAKSKRAKQSRTFAGMSVKSRNNYYFIFYTEDDNSFWVIPSRKVVRLGSKNESGRNKGTITLNIPKKLKSRRSDKFDIFKNDNGFRSLK